MLKFLSVAAFGFILMMKPIVRYDSDNQSPWTVVTTYQSMEICEEIGKINSRQNQYLCIPDNYHAQSFLAERSEEPFDQ